MNLKRELERIASTIKVLIDNKKFIEGIIIDGHFYNKMDIAQIYLDYIKESK